MVRLPPAAPIPPLALLGRQERVSCLGYGCAEDVEAADVLRLARDATEIPIKPFGVSAGQLGHTADSEQFKVAGDGRAD